MKIVKTIKNAEKIIFAAKQKNKTIGFVPTMGALHEGHLSLVRAAKKNCDFVAVSIFVNPTQFGPKEDFRKYPRTFNKDKELLQRENVNLIFYPSVSEMYTKDFSTYIEEIYLSKPFCGLMRPGHFRGVCTVVAKLFNIMEPDIAYFGQKDYQQALVVKRMVKDLNFNLTVKIVPTIREKDGLAMSSRNLYLNTEERQEATLIFKSLSLAKKIINSGEISAKNVIDKMRKLILSGKNTKIDYIAIADVDTLRCVDRIKGKIVIVLAVYLGRTRLIDNMILQVQ